MRILLVLLPFYSIIDVSCTHEAPSVEPAVTISDNNNQLVEESIPNGLPDAIVPMQQSWEDYQDSLRQILFKSKESKILKQSFLAEYYLRNVVKLKHDSVYFNLDFDLHGYDCGAPDCYSTLVKFHFKLGDSLVFPNEIAFKEKETGCIEKESNLSGKFGLVERTNEVVIYHDEKHLRNLILFSTNKKIPDYAFYIVGMKNEFTSANVVNELNKMELSADEKGGISAFRSTTLTTNEYERFLKN